MEERGFPNGSFAICFLCHQLKHDRDNSFFVKLSGNNTKCKGKWIHAFAENEILV